MKSRLVWNKTLQVVLFAVLYTVNKANSLKCYTCKGAEDGQPYPQSICEKEETEAVCTGDNTTQMACGKYHHEIKSGVLMHEVEGRACVPQHDCFWIGMSCRAIILAGGDCEYSCCDEDLCNSVSSLTCDKLFILLACTYGIFHLYGSD